MKPHWPLKRPLILASMIFVGYLGKGKITDLMKGLGRLTAEERPAAGQMINGETIGATDNNLRMQALKDEALNAKLAEEVIDVTLQCLTMGGLHP